MAGRGRKAGGSKGWLLVLLLAVLGGAGSWNYQRNMASENARPRPYKAYTEAQLEQLAAAYREQVETLTRRYEAATSRRTRSGDVKLLGEAVDQFDRVQRASRSVRELGAKLSQEQASLTAIEAEQALRASLGGPVATFLRRVFLPPA